MFYSKERKRGRALKFISRVIGQKRGMEKPKGDLGNIRSTRLYD